MTIENLYTINETAEKLKVSPSTIFNRMREGKLERIVCDGRTLISEKAIEKYLKQHTVKVVGSQDG